MDVIFEDNHLIAVNKTCHEIVQGDKTGDEPLADTLKAYLKEKYAKPGNVFVGVAHRLDRPVTGVVLFARTSKALARLNEMFRDGKIKKTYWAIVDKNPSIPCDDSGTLTHWLVRNEKQNKSFAYDSEQPNSKKAVLHYRIISNSDRYSLFEIALETGRHHQIRAQLAKIGFPVKGDLKYGSRRSNPDGGISLHARNLQFVHPVSKQEISITAEPPQDNLWAFLTQSV
ncbi:MAG: RluA family pseudouridine synthase [Tannerella sp.]|jgi:23S rRNA pseudouridine1911/1915/1917 synthase|nr:RluA family pseudouridine synthase [Tannerella sp.]